MQRNELLFHEHDWHSLQQHLSGQVEQDVAGMDPDRLLNTDPGALCAYIVEKYSLNLPQIRKEDISVDQREVGIDVSRRFDYGFSGYEPREVPGMEYEVHVPFTGDAGLFKTRPSQWSSNVPRGELRERESILVHRVRDVHLDPDQVNASIDGFVNTINEWLGWLKASTEQWNSQLSGKANNLVEARRQKLIADRNAASQLKYKLRDRPGTSRTYAAPEVRRKVVPNLPPSSSIPWKPEPVLEMSLYEEILRRITHAATTWEHSPGAFAGMGEEDLRTQLLFFLNGQFEGQGTAETFNKEGKTDILIRSQGRNIFIGECKFWGGAKVLTETIDQLLGYTSWRDTKVAVIIFNRNRNFSAVLNQIQRVTEAHINCKQFVSQPFESQFRFTFAHKDDPSRELTVTVMAFDVPQP